MPSPARKYSGPATPPPPSLSFAPISDPNLSWRACGILWALCHWAWGRKPECWPSNGQVAELVGCSERTVQLGMKELARAGYITRRMEKTDRGWFRVITITERAPRPELRIVEGERGGARSCATPPEGSCATPAQGVAPPLAQDPAPQSLRKPEEREKEPAAIVGPRGGAPTPPGPAEPEWLNVGNLNSADVEHWREIRDQPGHPMRAIAHKVLERWQRLRAGREPDPGFSLAGDTTAPGSPAKNPPGPTDEGTSPSGGNGIKKEASSQDKFPATEHKTH